MLDEAESVVEGCFYSWRKIRRSREVWSEEEGKKEEQGGVE